MMQQHKNACVLCQDNVEEAVDHLFFQCSFAAHCWDTLNIQWNMNLHIHDRILQARHSSALPFFMEICIITMWEIWKLWNRKVFDGHQVSGTIWITRFKDEVRLQSLRLKETQRVAIFSWLNQL
ncbi:hypothetical protein BS78_05G139300 [Paspalum vaginatum]|nr:hypothetical protein BS78_05G139300 [Paspalum vaginatum]